MGVDKFVHRYGNILYEILTKSRIEHKKCVALSQSKTYYICKAKNDLIITSKESLETTIVNAFKVGYKVNGKWHLYLNDEWNIEIYNGGDIVELHKI